MRLLLLTCCCLLSQNLLAEPDLRTELLASACATCHGYQGQAREPMPILAGMPAQAFLDAMRNFQTGKRESAVMQRHAQGYTEAELRKLADYFARQ